MTTPEKILLALVIMCVTTMVTGMTYMHQLDKRLQFEKQMNLDYVRQTDEALKLIESILDSGVTSSENSR